MSFGQFTDTLFSFIAQSIVNMVQHNHNLQTILDQSFGGKNARSIIIEGDENILEEYLSAGLTERTVPDDGNTTRDDRTTFETDGTEGMTTTADSSNILEEMYEVHACFLVHGDPRVNNTSILILP